VHVLQSWAGPGGETVLVDGFRIADLLRAEDPDAFRALATFEAVHSLHREEGDFSISARGRVIITEAPSGRVRSLRLNAYSLDAFDASGDDLTQLYRGFRRLGALAASQGLRLPLRQGDLLVLNNARVLYGRAPLPADADAAAAPPPALRAAPLLRAAYADIDAVDSRHRTLLAKIEGRGV
jgi:alpha-ketoglutarate-dependent taurine dioxygenase